jgi:hypothetical protein
MDRLENYITENREFFDDKEPGVGHVTRFERMLDQNASPGKTSLNRGLILKIAAAVLLLLTVSIILFDFRQFRTHHALQNGVSAGLLPSELQETIDYYQNNAEDHLDRFQKLACCGQDTRKLHHLATDELAVLDANTQELEKVLKGNPGDERVQSALIRNQRMKETVMKNMIQKIQNVKQ